ncbi:DUF6463 family protein [Aquimarina hainanensis]|uniref:DUF6463 family protein n=1 Tax=Aquimarina hainanensis TaxID=1578017 RepID=A0ABW5N3X1_9FLAO
MKSLNGTIIILTGIGHTLFGLSPSAFGKQFATFADHFFFKISEGLDEFPANNGQMNYENFAAFWFFYFGLLLIPLGIAVYHIEKNSGKIPKAVRFSYLALILVGIYMIPNSGMTFIMLPHALYMMIPKRSL